MLRFCGSVQMHVMLSCRGANEMLQDPWMEQPGARSPYHGSMSRVTGIVWASQAQSLPAPRCVEPCFGTTISCCARAAAEQLDLRVESVVWGERFRLGHPRLQMMGRHLRPWVSHQ